MRIWRRRYYCKWLGYILQKPTKNLELISIDRGSIITYRKNFEFDNEKKNFSRIKFMSDKTKKKLIKMVEL